MLSKNIKQIQNPILLSCEETHDNLLFQFEGVEGLVASYSKD